MSDDDPGVYTVLEDATVDPAPVPEPVQSQPEPVQSEAAPPAEPSEPAAEPDEDDLEQKAVEDRLTRERMVPLSEVSKLREKARTLKAERETISAKVADLEAKAARVAELEAGIQQWQTYAQQQAAQRQPAAQADPQAAERQQQADAARRTRAERIAKRFDLYKPDGTLDVDRGLEHLAEQEELAREQAAAMVQPLQEANANDRARMNQMFIQSKIRQAGVKIDPGILGQLSQHLGPQLMQDTNVALVSHSAAVGWPIVMAALRGDNATLQEYGITPAQGKEIAAKAQAVPLAPEKPSPVVVTEPVNQRVVGAPRLAGPAARAARELGLTAEQVDKQYSAKAPWTVLADDVESR